MRLSSASATDTGLRRSINEDNLSVRDDLGLYVVADGMGGHAAGDVASEAAVEGIVAFVEATVAMSPDCTGSGFNIVSCDYFLVVFVRLPESIGTTCGVCHATREGASDHHGSRS